MKRFILTIGILSLMFNYSCKKEENTDNSNELNKSLIESSHATSSDEIEKIPIPKLSNPEVQAYAKEFADAMYEMVDAEKSRNEAKMTEITSKVYQLLEKGEEIEKIMNDDDKQKLEEWFKKIAVSISKAAPEEQ